MAEEDDENHALGVKLIICLIAAASVSLIVTIYHCITSRLQLMRQHQQHIQMPPQHQMPPPQQGMIIDDSSVAELLPTHKFQKCQVEDGLSCAICLCEFEEGEELRTMPECTHSYHAGCIDMWLYSHSNCPMCRTIVGQLIRQLGQQQSSPTRAHLLYPGGSTRESSITILQMNNLH